MLFYDSDGLKRASCIYKPCMKCGKRDFLKVRVASKYDFRYKETQNFYSVRCEDCKLIFGEEEGQPIYDSESDLIAAWNCRKY